MAEPSAGTFADLLRLRTDADLTPAESRVRA
jgi:hypothetical protein